MSVIPGAIAGVEWDIGGDPVRQVDAAPFIRTLEEFPYGAVSRDSSFGTFLMVYGLMSHQRPGLAVEIGACRGATTIWMARAIAEAGCGELVSYEVDHGLADIAEGRLSSALGEGPWRIVRDGFLEAYDGRQIDFLFMDPDPKSLYARMFEAINWSPGAVMAAHDLTLGGPEGDQVRAFAETLRASGEWEVIGFPQERGLLVARRLA